ncbi:hypothetical protein HPB49_025117 [Dermacentor silvarum]|uniref:Uncharacterized protein n=1 Tax=Dermacentor silvarum TaxID=543639 RepID=A0ACB8C6B1_DERSI|nr:hypothetical protein HPB49_025117 [Dermacentor silvarum]
MVIFSVVLVHTYSFSRDCTHVFLQHGAVRPPRQPHYHGPFNVIKRCPKHFIVLLKGRDVSVSMDRIKSAFLYTDSILADDKRTTNNRHVHFTFAGHTNGSCRSLTS